MNLRQWFFRNFVLFGISAFLSLSFLILIIFYNGKTNTDYSTRELIKNQASIISTAIDLHERGIIESSILTVLNFKGIGSVALCDGSKVILGSINDCQSDFKIGIPGKENFNLFYSFSDWVFWYHYFPIILIFIVSFFVYFYLLRKLSNKVITDVVRPLETMSSMSPIIEITSAVQALNSKIDVEIKSAILKEKEGIAIKVCHDLRSPLSALANLRTELLKSDYLPVFDLSLQRLDEISSDLLHKTKVDECIKIIDLIDKLIEQKKVEYFKREVIFSFTYSKDIQVLANKGDLGRVISNLINNAVEAVPGNQIAIIKIHLKKNPDNAELIIEDNGVGMDEETLSKIGTKKFTTKGFKGNGIGVDSAISYLATINSELFYTSIVNHGTIVKVVFNSVQDS